MARPLPLLLLLSLPVTGFATSLSGDNGPATTKHTGDETAQRGRLAGVVKDEKGLPVEGVTVALKGTSFGTTTNTDGSFRLSAPAGSYQLVVSSLGYTTQELSVTVAAGETTTLSSFTLAQSSQQLSEVTVTGNRSLNERPTSVSKLPVASLDLPQSAVTVERQVLEQQQVLRLSDALVNVSGLYVTSTTGGTQEELGSRGFAYGSNNTFKNGVRFNNGVMPEASSLERMEVLKGSAAILYGNVAAGGVLNLVTKKPQFERGGSVGLRVGSFGFWKPMVDVYGAVGNSENVAFRLNGTYEQGNSFRDEVKSDRVYVNPSLLFTLTPKTTLVLEGDYLRDNRTPDFGIGAINYQVQESRSRFLNVSGANNATQQTSTTATLTSRLNDTWQIRGVAGYQRYNNELRSASRPVASAAAATYGDLTRSLQRTETNENYFLAQLDLTGKFRTGALEHTVLVGADADQYLTNTLAYSGPTSATNSRTSVTAYDAINILDRNKVVAQPKERIGGFGDLVRNLSTRSNTRRAGFYAQDLLSVSEKVKVLAGIRWSYQETPSDLYYYNTAANRSGTNKNGPLAGQLVNNRRYDDAFSPRLGVVYQPIKTTALFASYSNSFTPQSNTAVDLNGQPLPPSIIDQYEVGIKNDLFKGALSANVTAYRIVNSNQIQSVLPTDPRFTTQFSTSPQELAGEVTSKGVEVDIQSKPMYGLSFIAGYSYNHTAYTNSNIFENGSRLRYNPAHTANLSLFYNFGSTFGDNGFLRGLTAGITTYYVGDKLAGRNPRLVNPADGKPWATGADANQFITIPNYMQLDASLGYSYDRFSVRVKLANLLNELSYNMHDDNSVNPIAPRNFAATLGYRL
ncbi:iron complex outermembrane receptor protein [Hymenobacter luteus]|uniref:Iron complex outermembrane receptor protein n=2 Tax=Hymenobacter TaxID=89966 RepID=A0A7W9T1R3_9BACT|nr:MULTISPECIES: TonB-dependent receptor [Hymenobacter]MBB4601571.1 iron complex outermembrane receptor protein [Hymenobacter latericoloratus]MBB6060001.1 iron complex outermembrane receptor protein [Hymenobacter luteus]